MSIDIVAATPELQSPALPPGGRATCERSAGCALSLGGRRSDIRRKHDVVQLRRLDNGLGYYRFAYNGSEKAYVGVIAQQVRSIRPDAAFCRSRRLSSGFSRTTRTAFPIYDDWAASGGRLPKPADH
jgi:hypothetical protein